MKKTPQLALLFSTLLFGTPLFSTLLFSTVAVAFAGPKISPDLRSMNPASTATVIVQYKHPPTLASHQKVANQGGLLQQVFQAVKGATYTLPLSSLKSLEAEDEVLYISPNRKLQRAAASLTYDYTPQAVGASTVTPGLADGVGVAVIDSGITTNQDLSGLLGLNRSVVYQQSFVSDGKYGDPYGHGTHVAGIITGSGTNSAGPLYSHQIKGIAPGSNLIDLRVLDRNGSGTDAMVIQAIEQAIALKARYNIRVINLSLGRPVFESYTLDPLCQAVESAWKAGIVVVVAAGNSGRDNSAGTMGYATISAPGNDPFVITVG
ncbi:MAG: S8 family serine peptidase, partial [Acidobacteriota bacterium]|nr:S8 family serine peptidase [Acidobacteriota bacterium]